MPSAPSTLYQVLGITRDASTSDIEGAFREKLADLKAHPNLNQGAIDELREAYRILTSPGRRADYDEMLPKPPAERRAAARAPSHRASAVPLPSAPLHDDSMVGEFLSSPLARIALVVMVLIAIGMWFKSGSPKSDLKGPEVRVVSQTTTTEQAAASSHVAEERAISTAAPIHIGSAEEVFSGVSGSIARIRVSNANGDPVGQGSGVVIDHGVIITNCHVSSMGERLSVKVAGSEFAATVSQSDEERDLCKLHVPGLQAMSVPLASVASLRVGQRVYAVGAPHGLELTLSEGIVSSLRETPDGPVIQTTAPISPGSSGGGLFDAGGRMVGVVTFQHKLGQNLNFALPSDWILQMGARAK